MDELFEMPDHVKAQMVNPNPMVRKAGRGPEGKTCKTCVYLLRDRYHCKTYYKCEYRGRSRAAGTDHRLKWDACQKYREENS